MCVYLVENIDIFRMGYRIIVLAVVVAAIIVAVANFPRQYCNNHGINAIWHINGVRVYSCVHATRFEISLEISL